MPHRNYSLPSPPPPPSFNSFRARPKPVFLCSETKWKRLLRRLVHRASIFSLKSVERANRGRFIDRQRKEVGVEEEENS